MTNTNKKWYPKSSNVKAAKFNIIIEIIFKWNFWQFCHQIRSNEGTFLKIYALTILGLISRMIAPSFFLIVIKLKLLIIIYLINKSKKDTILKFHQFYHLTLRSNHQRHLEFELKSNCYKCYLQFREGFTKKSCCSFGFCPNYLPPSP